MNRADFLARLSERLDGMPEQDRADALRYFEELIQDKAADQELPEEQIIRDLGSPDSIADTLLEGAAHKQQQGAKPEGDEPDSVIRTLTFAALQARDIHIDVYDLPIVIRPGKEDEVVVSFPEDEDFRFNATLDNGRLQLTRQRPRKLRVFRLDWWVLGIGPSREVTLHLPADFAGTLDARTSNNKISMDGINLWGDLQLTSSNARLEVTRCAARQMTLTTSNGRLEAHHLSAKGNMTLRTSNGTMNVEDLAASGDVGLQTGNARITAKQVSAGGSLSLRSSNGPLQVGRLEAQDITLRTSNSAITGAVEGAISDYSVVSSTSNGKNSLADHPGRGPKRLEAHTSNASIRLTFAGG